MSPSWKVVRASALAALVASGFAAPTSLLAQETKVAKADDSAKDDFYTVPASDDAKVLGDFIKKVKAFRPTSRDEYVNHLKKSPEALKTAAEKILTIDKDPKSAANRAAQGVLLGIELQGLQNADEGQRAAIYDKVRAYIDASDKTREDLQLAFGVASGLEYSGAKDLAGKAYEELGKLLATSSDKQVASTAETLIGASRRMKLMGNELKLEGTTTDGKPFNIDSLKGKVVLVDFWATWCGPCIAEYPNIENNYKAYHDKGFDVVGVSLDSDRQALEKYITDKHVPWTTLHEKEGGGEHPAAKYYGVLGIPTVILVNKEGKVISLNARGPELGKLLEKELGAPEKTEETKQ